MMTGMWLIASLMFMADYVVSGWSIQHTRFVQLLLIAIPCDLIILYLIRRFG
jgi:cation transport ATPase